MRWGVTPSQIRTPAVNLATVALARLTVYANLKSAEDHRNPKQPDFFFFFLISIPRRTTKALKRTKKTFEFFSAVKSSRFEVYLFSIDGKIRIPKWRLLKKKETLL